MYEVFQGNMREPLSQGTSPHAQIIFSFAPYLMEITDEKGASQVAHVVKYPPANAEVSGDTGLIPGLGRCQEKEVATH